MIDALRRHGPEYLMEGALLGLFMVSACTFGALLEHPASALRRALPDPFARRVLMGIAMGATAVALVYSPWGQQSGAHFNPAVTLTFFRLGKVKALDALFYPLFQIAGAVVGVAVAALALGSALAHENVSYVMTLPAKGIRVAFVMETLISFLLMSTVLFVSNDARLSKYTGFFAGALVALYIAFEAPLSGMSMNVARSFGSAVFGRNWTGFWIYAVAPLLGMLLAAEVRVQILTSRSVACAKLNHHTEKRCIFCADPTVAPSPSH